MLESNNRKQGYKENKMNYSTKTINRYSNMHPRMIINLSNKQFEIFLEIMWWHRKRYITKESTAIFPCMLGKFTYNGKSYNCTITEIKEI